MDSNIQNRAVHRGQITKLSKYASDYLASGDAQATMENSSKFAEIEEEISVFLQRIMSAHEFLKKANKELYSAPAFKAEDKEFETSADYEDKAVSIIARLQHRLSRIRALQGNPILISSEPSPPAVNHHSATKLPKLQLKRFSGDLNEWLPFWQQFKSTIHENSNLSGPEKFNYLQSLLTGKAADTIAGFTPSESCYDGAIALLQEEFGQCDQLIEKNMQRLMTLPPVTSAHDLVGLRKLYNAVIAITRSLTALEVPSTHYGVMLKTILLKCMPSELRINFHRINEDQKAEQDNVDDCHDSVSAKSDASSIIFEGDKQVRRILQYLKREVQSLEKSNVNSFRSAPTHKSHGTATGLLTTNNDNKCCFCNSSEHISRNCISPHTIAQRKDLLRQQGRCFRCTSKGHRSKFCKVKDLKCVKCDGRHSSAMCEVSIRNNKKTVESSAVAGSSKHTFNFYSNDSSDLHNVYLQTACAYISTPSQSLSSLVRLIIDGGSQGTYIKQSIARKLNLPIVGEKTIQISTFGRKKKSPTQRCNLVSFTLKSQYNDRCVSVVALEVQEICNDFLAPPSSDQVDFSRFSLADVNLNGEELHEGISILIGSDNFWSVITGEYEILSPKLAAVNTVFGWTIQGPVSSESPVKYSCLSTVVLHAYATEHFKESYLWDLDTIGITNEDSSKALIEEDFNKYVRKNGERYYARLLWRDNSAVLDSFREGAQKRFGSLIRKLLREPHRLLEYERAMEELINDGIAEEVNYVNEQEAPSRIYYLPHRAVYREDKSTSKLRIVFDASAHQGNNASLNSLLSPGYNLLPDVLEVLLNFRLGKIGLVADIEKAFLQIELAEEDRDTHRFFWFGSKIKDYNNLPAWKEFRMTRVTFGIACSPFLLCATIRRHLNEEKMNFPEICSYLENSFYMDDLIISVDDELLATKIYQESTSIMQRASMRLRKWNCNSQQVKANFNLDANCPDMQKILGLRWYTVSDELMIDLEAVISSLPLTNATKKDVLSLISRIYDPLGMLGPYLVKLKLIFQSTWKRKLDWDAVLPDDLQKSWIASVKELPCLSGIAIPRGVLVTSQPHIIELHIFADASTQAYGAVAYIKCFDIHEKCEVRYLCSKNRIAPLRESGLSELTLPKLELTAALIAVRLCVYLKKKFRMKFDSVIFWSDSKIALSWINGDYRRWKPFVAHRVQEIRKNSEPQNWRHCPSERNPADLLTRGLSGTKLANSYSWLNGPEWLVENNNDNYGQIATDHILETSSYLTCLLVDEVSTESLPLGSSILVMENYSRYSKLLRVTAYVMRFVRFILQRGKVPIRNKFLTASEISIAEKYWIAMVQRQEYSAELEALTKRKPVSESSSIKMLNPILNSSKFLCVGTRLDDDYPIIIPRQSPLAKLIVREIHQRMFHAGINLLLAELRKRFWIPRARQLIKSTIRPCVICKRLRGKAASQPFAPLPRSRLSASRPFETTGVDFAGPLYVKEIEGSTTTRKYYVMLLTCAVIRAVHLELVPNLTTESCIMALRRFIARRGVPKVIISDNAKTFKRASIELQELGKVLSSEEFQGFTSNQGIVWNFIVERAPWWGGFWERLIRSIKDILKIAVGRSTLNAEQLVTLLVEAENIVNSRPLTYISDDPLDFAPLTPANFLYGEFSSLPSAISAQADQNIRLKWKSRLRIINFFWKRFKTEYLQQLRSAHYAIKKSAFTVKKGDIVLVHDHMHPRILWKLALVEAVFPGRDGKIRACEVRLSNGSRLRRPVQLLYPLELSPGEDVEN